MLRVAFESVTNSRYGIVGEQLKKKIERREREDDTSPFEVVPEYLKPAERLSQLSPADRLFGWVSETGSSERNSSWAGQLSIGPIGFPTNPRALRSPKKITLSVLASPKIQQTLFYAARSSDPKQAPKPSTTEKYEQGLLPRGRKVYPHQRDWQRSNAEEHRRKDGQVVTDKQNQTFKDWIPIGSIFEFVITVRNASANDLGGLYFLLSLADDQFHRFGGGKPLGFGSVRLRVVKHEVSSGDDWREALRELNPPFRLTNDDLEGMKNGFRTEVEKQSWGRAVLSAFEAATRGFDNLATRYPRRFAEPKWLPLLDKSSAPVLRHTNGGGNRGGGNNPR
jgi:CRISPR-associated protein (TIGR03986 family)